MHKSLDEKEYLVKANLGYAPLNKPQSSNGAHKYGHRYIEPARLRWVSSDGLTRGGVV